MKEGRKEERRALDRLLCGCGSRGGFGDKGLGELGQALQTCICRPLELAAHAVQAEGRRFP
jgi:hypothetical protein